jgi:hypothetical protein
MNNMDPITAGMTIGGAILGKIGMRRRRREERKRRAREKKFALQAQTALIGTVDGLREDYRTRAGFAREEFGIRQSSAIQGYQAERPSYLERSAMDTMIGGSNLAYSGSAETASKRLDDGFRTQLEAENLTARQEMSAITKGFESELRGVQVGLLNLERTASERGYSIPSMGASFNTNPTGLGGIV